MNSLMESPGPRMQPHEENNSARGARLKRVSRSGGTHRAHRPIATRCRRCSTRISWDVDVGSTEAMGLMGRSWRVMFDGTRTKSIEMKSWLVHPHEFGYFRADIKTVVRPWSASEAAQAWLQNDTVSPSMPRFCMPVTGVRRSHAGTMNT